jgi:hypothetical protein
MSFAQMLRSFAVLAIAAALVLTISGPVSAQGNGTQHSSGAFSVTIPNDCTGELVDIDVTYMSTAHFVAEKNSYQVDMLDVYIGRGVGETTGTMYIANQTDSVHMSFHGVINGQAVTSLLQFEMVSADGSPNLEFQAVLHDTVDANGVITSFVDNFSLSCKG